MQYSFFGSYGEIEKKRANRSGQPGSQVVYGAYGGIEILERSLQTRPVEEGF